MLEKTEVKSLKKALRNELGFKNLEVSRVKKNTLKRHKLHVLNSYEGGELLDIGIPVDTIVLGSRTTRQKFPALEAKAKTILERFKL
ncbi:hypothetical protein FACS1894176_09020 [Bacteroidia bacterium]|nr:hypothetical protein FACS189428_1610 [Clostridia bacterium]GHV27281.1 hypothetical protein FACS1894176_09020 [Bacteroidia bacterium]